MARRKTEMELSARENNAAFMYYVDRLTELALSSFQYDGLPDSIDPRFLELTLFQDGQACIFKDEEMGLLALQVVINGGLDVYRVPVRFRAFAVNGYNRQLTNKDGVIIYNNMIRSNSYPVIKMFARRLWNYDRIIAVNANAQKTPVLIVGTDQQRLTLQNVYMKWDGNEPVIFGDKNMDWQSMSVLKTDAPYVADKITELKNNVWNEALTYLGISNVTISKKERLITDEVNRAMGGVIASRYSRLNARRQALDKVNELFGTNITVNFREDVEPEGEGVANAGNDFE